MTKHKKNVPQLSLNIMDYEVGLGRKRSEIHGDGTLLVEKDPEISLEEEIAFYELGLGRNRSENHDDHPQTNNEIENS